MFFKTKFNQFIKHLFLEGTQFEFWILEFNTLDDKHGNKIISQVSGTYQQIN
jgi:hypothetical protein